ncbi:MAG: large-conductance mechanosensitive channel protein [Bacteroidetes bacterium 46-16]|nr:MAG: large-conductance mechanosensitive channel protein [Bacteroidetes bacterium 46-16]
MGFMKEFKAFALKGNVVDLAVGVIIGAAFGKIVTSLVNDVIMPFVGLIGDGKKFTDKFIVLKPGKDGADHFATLIDAKAAGANVFAYGDFIQTVVDFLIIAFCIFMFVKLFNSMKKKEEAAPAAPPAPTATETLLTEIRDELKKKS